MYTLSSGHSLWSTIQVTQGFTVDLLVISQAGSPSNAKSPSTAVELDSPTERQQLVQKEPMAMLF